MLALFQVIEPLLVIIQAVFVKGYDVRQTLDGILDIGRELNHLALERDHSAFAIPVQTRQQFNGLRQRFQSFIQSHGFDPSLQRNRQGCATLRV